jgi:hypothetical protein
MKSLNDVITNFSIGKITKEEIIQEYNEMFFKLLTLYLNDKNSSTLRQIITCEVIGIKSNENKLGYDGDGTNDEVKPKNVNSNFKKGKKVVLNGNGNYSDITHARHKKYINDDVSIHVSGFVDGNLLYIIKVPYRSMSDLFKNKLNIHLPNGDEPSKYVRSVSFTFTNYKNCEGVKIEFIRDNIEDYIQFINKNFYIYLNTLCNDK